MRVIDLLNKIANGEELPKRFIYVDKENVRYIFDIEEDKDYWCEELGDWFFSNFSIQTILNEKVEIIEEDKEIEEIKLDSQLILEWNLSQIENKINELVKAVNELKKGE